MNLGRYAAWPYVDGLDLMNFRERDYLRNLNTVYMILQELKTQDKDILAELDRDADEGLSMSLRGNLKWRRNHLGIDEPFWNLHGPDNPTHASEGLALRHEPKDQITPIARDIEESALSQYHAFKDAQLVRNAFRAFHRPDGRPELSLHLCFPSAVLANVFF